MGFCAYAQGIIGKWKTNEEYKSGFECWSEIDYKNNGTFTVKMLMRSQDERYLDNGVLVDVIVKMNGNYECSGKAFSHTFDENSIIIDTEVSFTPECTVSEGDRKKLQQIFKEQRGDDSGIRSMAKLYTSGGMYKQILLLNHERMILGRPGGEVEEFTRIISEEELAAATSKRESERAKWKAARIEPLKEAAEDEAADFISQFKAEHPGARTTESGLVYYIQEKGSPGTNALSGEDVVYVNYCGYYLNGLGFAQENDIELRLKQVIPGWREGIKMVGEGGQITIVVPYSLAYGENGNGIIPPYSTLVYDIEVLKVQLSGERSQQDLVSATIPEKEEGGEHINDSTSAEQLAIKKAATENASVEREETERNVVEIVPTENNASGEAAGLEKKLSEPPVTEIVEPNQQGRSVEVERVSVRSVVVEKQKTTEKNKIAEQTPVVPDAQVQVNERSFSNSGGIYRKGGKLYLSGTNTLITINDLYDSSSWTSYQKGASLMKAGIYCYVASGVSAALIGTAIAYTNYDTSESVMKSFKDSGLGVAVACAVPVCAVAGIVLRMTGKSMINRVANKQNGTFVSSVSIGATPNGIGLAYNF